MEESIIKKLKREIFLSENFEQKTLEQAIEEVKEIQHQLRVYRERSESAEREIELIQALAYKIRFKTAR